MNVFIDLVFVNWSSQGWYPFIVSKHQLY